MPTVGYTFAWEFALTLATFMFMIGPATGAPLPLLLPIFLYAEMHYRFKLFPFSRYYKREPEILADAPYRLEKNGQLPILVLVKDAHRFPIQLHYVDVALEDETGTRKELRLQKNLAIESRWWHEILRVDISELSESCTVRVEFSYTVRGKHRWCINHNLATSEEKPLSVYLATDSLPGTDRGWHWGDLHYHSWLTEDYVEFGAPLDATREAAKAAGLSFVCLTDHSYDLDDKPDSWTKTDPELTKWKQSRAQISHLNHHGLPLLIPGEEVTSISSSNKNVHTLVLNNPEFYPGSGDGAERLFGARSELSIRKLIKVQNAKTVVIAAHPRMRIPFLQRLLLRRGQWQTEDYQLGGTSGFQIVNGNFDQDFEDGLRHWIETLLRGEKKFIYAGNDAHGNFNRFRQIKIPMLSLWDHTGQILGQCRTGIFLSGQLTLKSALQALKRGRCVVSNGPLLEIKASTYLSSMSLGESLDGNNVAISIDCRSSREFGELKEVAIILGEMTVSKERVLDARHFPRGSYGESYAIEFDASSIRGYVRGKLVSRTTDGKEFFCYTNPIWINS